MKFILIILGFILMHSYQKEDSNIFDYTVETIRGQEISLSEYKDHVILIVNTASMCGYTSQYEELQELHETYLDRKFVVLGFPSGDFGEQEFGTNEEIQEFCEVNFNISFPLFSKVSVKGDDKHLLFDYLTSVDNQDYVGDINWNFEKFLISRNGQLIRRFRSDTKPLSNELTSAVEELL